MSAQSHIKFRPVKVVETAVVDDHALEKIINEWGEKGYDLENVDYIQNESSRRPVMAFLYFQAPLEPVEEGAS